MKKQISKMQKEFKETKLQVIKPASKNLKKAIKEINTVVEPRKIRTKTVFHFNDLEWQARRKYSDYAMYGQICIYAIRNDGKIVDRYNFITLEEHNNVDLVEAPGRKINFPNQAKVTIPTSAENKIKIYIVFGINEDDREVGVKFRGVPECYDNRTPFYNGGSDDFYVIDKQKTLNTNGSWFSVTSNGKASQEIYFDATVTIEGQKTVYVDLHHDDDMDYQVDIQFNVSKEIKSYMLD